MGEPLTDEQIAEEEKFLAGLPRVNLGALFLAPVWGPAHGIDVYKRQLYTWYNVVGFWNPYDNTGNLTVCVVNQDAGGSSELTGELNVGERIVDQLHENNQLHWEFTDYDAAMNELKGGRAYAAYVIPEHFTADLLTITLSLIHI